MRNFFILVVAILLQACAAVGGDAYMLMNAVRQSWGPGPALPDFSTGLDPQYRYLMVQLDDARPSLLVLGFEDLTPNGLMETWYARNGGFIQTLNGRLANVQGVQTQWSSVQFSTAPGLGEPDSASLLRMRDVMPGYVHGVTDNLTPFQSTFDDVPADVLPQVAGREVWSKYRWFKEQVVTLPVRMSVGDSWLAVGPHRGMRTVVASYQCLTANYCLKTVRWPVDASAN